MLIEPQWVILGGIAVLATGGVLLARAAERKRREALEGFSLMRGFRFEAERPGAEAPLAAFFEPFRSGHSRKWETPGGRLPAFTLGPENLLTRLAGVFGGQDIDFADTPEFSSAYRLRGADEAAIRAFLTPALRQYLALTPARQIAAGGAHLLLWRGGRLPKPDQLEQFLMEGDALARQLLKQ